MINYADIDLDNYSLKNKYMMINYEQKYIYGLFKIYFKFFFFFFYPAGQIASK